MGVNINIHYTGELNCSLEHEPSKTLIATDAPKDNRGRGEAFSPTDLVAAALCSCAFTTMAIKGADFNIPFSKAHGQIVKEMTQAGPRKIKLLNFTIHMSKDLNLEQRKKLEDIAIHCPVALSLASEVEVIMKFIYSL